MITLNSFVPTVVMEIPCRVTFSCPRTATFNWLKDFLNERFHVLQQNERNVMLINRRPFRSHQTCKSNDQLIFGYTVLWSFYYIVCLTRRSDYSGAVTQENSSVILYKFMTCCLGSLEDKPDPRFVRKAFNRSITNA